MKRVIKKRREGKTTTLVNEVKQNGGILIVANSLTKDCIIHKFGLGEAQVIPVTELENLKGVPNDIKLYVDDVDFVIGILLEKYGVLEGFSIACGEV